MTLLQRQTCWSSRTNMTNVMRLTQANPQNAFFSLCKQKEMVFYFNYVMPSSNTETKKTFSLLPPSTKTITTTSHCWSPPWPENSTLNLMNIAVITWTYTRTWRWWWRKWRSYRMSQKRRKSLTLSKVGFINLGKVSNRKNHQRRKVKKQLQVLRLGNPWQWQIRTELRKKTVQQECPMLQTKTYLNLHGSLINDYFKL